MTTLSNKQRNKLLKLAVEDYGYETLNEMLEDAIRYSVCIGVCTNGDCNAMIDEIEPDQTEGFCEDCGEQTIVSVAVLAGII